MCNTYTVGNDQLTQAQKQQTSMKNDNIVTSDCSSQQCIALSRIGNGRCFAVFISKCTDVWAHCSAPAGAHHSTYSRDNFIIQSHDAPTWTHDQGCRTRTLSLCLRHSSLLVTDKNGKEVPRVCLHTSVAPSQWQQLFVHCCLKVFVAAKELFLLLWSLKIRFQRVVQPWWQTNVIRKGKSCLLCKTTYDRS